MSETVIALGFFDGVHLGHAALLRRAVEEAKIRNAVSAIFTFDRPPKEVVTGKPCPLINSPQDRADLARRLYGIREVITAPFDQRMMTTPWDEFIPSLIERFHAVHLIAGHDHKFGYLNAGNPELLAQKCAELNIGCDIISPITIGGEIVSSSHIRELLKSGDVENANRFLGHPHVLTQEVRHGNQIGRSMGIPTMNFIPPFNVLIPARGVYISVVVLPDGTRCPGVTNIGVRPTIHDGEQITIETWLLNFDGDLYGRRVRLEFRRRLRDEISFPSLEDLQRQILIDADQARLWFREHPM